MADHGQVSASEVPSAKLRCRRSAGKRSFMQSLSRGQSCNSTCASCADYETVSIEQPIHELPVKERLWAALERQTANNPHRRALHAAAATIRASKQGCAVSTAQLAKAWAVVSLQRCFHFFTPSRLRLSSFSSCAHLEESRFGAPSILRSISTANL